MSLTDGLQGTRHTAGPLHWQYHDWTAVPLGCVVISRRIGRSTEEDNCMFISNTLAESWGSLQGVGFLTH